MVATEPDNNMEATQHVSRTKQGTNIVRHRKQQKTQQGRDNNTSLKAAIEGI
jgi:hypothetical protein